MSRFFRSSRSVAGRGSPFARHSDQMRFYQSIRCEAKPNNFFRRALAIATVAGVTAAAFSFGEKLVARAEEALTPSEILSKEIQLDASSDIDALRAKFLKFATVNEDGESLMTFDDFARAHLNGSYTTATPEDFDRLKGLFSVADVNKNGVLELSEYVLFYSLLTKPQAAVHISFRLFDIDGDGYIDKDELSAVLHDQWGSEVQELVMANENLMKTFFGEKGDQKVSYEDYKKMLTSVNDEMKKSAFFRKADPNTKMITSEDFSTILKESHEVMPLYFQQHLIRINNKRKQIDYDFYQSYLNTFKHHEAIERTISVYTGAGGKLDRDSFSKAMKITSSVDLNPTQLDIVFDIFDVEKTGVLNVKSYDYLQSHKGHVAAALKEKKDLSLLQSLAFGAISSSFGATCVYPMDKIKTRVQSSRGSLGPSAALKNIITGEGLIGLYRGLPAVLLGITPEKTLKLVVNNYLRRWLRTDETKPLPTRLEAVAGIGTGLVQVFVTNPYELLKIRLQMQTPDKPRKGLVTIVREVGLRGLYTGLPATLFRDVPFNGIYFYLYAVNKENFKDKDGQLGPMRLLASSAVAAAIAAAVDTPADCLKTRLQNGQGQYKGLWDCFRKTVTTEGYKALLKGVEVRVIIIAPLFAITFATFETLQRIWAPNTRNKVDILEDDFESMRKARIQNIADELKSQYGVEIRL